MSGRRQRMTAGWHYLMPTSLSLSLIFDCQECTCNCLNITFKISRRRFPSVGPLRTHKYKLNFFSLVALEECAFYHGTLLRCLSDRSPTLSASIDGAL